MRSIVGAGLAGLLFALGLGLGGMTDPAKVVGFLDFAGAWDPSLAFVMAGALGTHALLRKLILRKRETPILAGGFPALTNNKLDARLIGGAAIFGIGWGLAGYCPGPAYTSLAAGSGEVILFVGAMSIGMLTYSVFERVGLRPRAEARARRLESAEPVIDA